MSSFLSIHQSASPTVCESSPQITLGRMEDYFIDSEWFTLVLYDQPSAIHYLRISL